MGLPLITVITAVYRDFSHLDETFASIAAQSYPNIETILCDDGSENFSREQAEEMLKAHDLSCTVLHSDKNLGTVRNINGAIAHSHGKYIFFLSSGDTYADDAVLDDWVRFFEQTHARASLALRHTVDRPDADDGLVLPEQWQQNAMESLNCHALFRLLSLGNFVSGSTCAYDGDFLRAQPFDENYRLLEDYPKALQLLSDNVRIHLFPRICVRHLRGGISASTRLHPALVKDHVLVCQTFLSTPPAYRFAADYLLCALNEKKCGVCKQFCFKFARRVLLEWYRLRLSLLRRC